MMILKWNKIYVENKSLKSELIGYTFNEKENNEILNKIEKLLKDSSVCWIKIEDGRLEK